MTESAQNGLNPAAASTRSDNSECSVFLRHRADKSLPTEQFARAVFEMPLFEAKRDLVANVVAEQWPAELVEDAMQEAVLNTWYYLVATRGARFSGIDDDALGGWLYVVLRQHAEWALRKIVRHEKRRRVWEIAAARRDCNRTMSMGTFASLFDQVFAMIEKLPTPLRAIAIDLHYGVPAKDTATTCCISERRVYELRTKVLSYVSRLVDDLA